MQNHLFIGLGGQGGKTIAALRRVIESRKSDVEELRAAGRDWDFLYIDSSRDVTNFKKTWTHFGKNLSLQPDSIIYLKDDGASIEADEIVAKAGIAPWIGDVSLLKAFLVGAKNIVGANQRRRIGRILFSRNSAQIKNACQAKINRMLTAANQCAIHVFASLAGGTGSGCLIDLVTTLRTAYPNSSTEGGFPIFLYLYVTDEKLPESQVGFFHENQTAVLRDLNAIVCERFNPHLMDSPIFGATFNNVDPVTQIVLSSSITKENQRLSIDQQHLIIAEAAFERIYCHSTGKFPDEVQKAITGEDKIGNFPGEPKSNLERTFRFGALGMRRWEVPIEQISEVLTSDLTHCCWANLLYQNWSEKSGPSVEKVNSLEGIKGYRDLVNTILKSIHNETAGMGLGAALRESLEAEALRFHAGKSRDSFRFENLEDYEIGLRERYLNHLGGSGVESCFQSIKASRNQRIGGIRASIHEHCRAAVASVASPIGFAYLDRALQEVQQQVKLSIHSTADLPDESNLRNRMDLRANEWRKLTSLSRPFRQAALAAAHRLDTLDILRDDLRKRIASEDNDFLNSVVALMAELITGYKGVLKVLEERMQTAGKSRDRLLQEFQELMASQKGAGAQRVSNRLELSIDDVKNHIALQKLDRQQISNASSLLLNSSLFELLGGEPLTYFSSLTPVEVQKIDDVAETIMLEQTQQIHDFLHESHHCPRVLSGSILDILQSRYQKDPDSFTSELSSFINSSAPSVQLRGTSEEQPKNMVEDENMPMMPRVALVIGLPRQHSFVHVLQKVIPTQIKRSSIDVYSVYFHDDPTQIRMLTLVYFMAARFAQVVHDLEKIYTQSLKSGNAVAIKYFTNIEKADGKNARCPLLLPEGENLQTSVKSLLWIGSRINAPKTDQRLLIVTAEELRVVSRSETGIQITSLAVSVENLKINPIIVTWSRLREFVESAIQATETVELQSIRHDVELEDQENLKRWGVDSNEYGAWIPVRDEICNLLTR
jgi:hypothetical protein